MTTPTRLFSRILSLAIQGKLVSNHADDTVDDLLKEIAVNNSARKKSKSEPIPDDQIPFAIPDNWKWVRLGEVCEFINGRAYKQDELLDTGKYKVLRVGNFFTNNSWYYSDLELEENKYCNKGDLLYAWSASFGPKIWDGDKTIFHYHIWNVKFNENCIDKQYLYYFFDYDKSKILESTTGSTMIHVSMQNMVKRYFPLPPLSIQSRIVSKLNEIKALVDDCEDIENGLEKDCELLRKKVLDLALRGRLTTQLPSDGDAQSLIDQIEAEKAKSSAKNKKYIPPQPVNPDDAPFQIPDNWKWVRLGEIGEMVRGNGIKRTETTPTGKPCLRYGEIYTSYLYYFDKAKSYVPDEVFNKCVKIQKGDLVFTLTGENNIDIAKTLAYLGEDEVAAGGDLAVWKNHHCEPKFLAYAMYSHFMINQKSDTATGDLIVHISASKVGQFLFPLPPLAEQSRIVAKIEEVFAQIDNLRM